MCSDVWRAQLTCDASIDEADDSVGDSSEFLEVGCDKNHRGAFFDGITYEQVGLRLKGNSSLMSLSGRGVGGAGGVDAAEATLGETMAAFLQRATRIRGLMMP